MAIIKVDPEKVKDNPYCGGYKMIKKEKREEAIKIISDTLNIDYRMAERVMRKLDKLGYRILDALFKGDEEGLLTPEEIKGCWTDDTINPETGGYDANKVTLNVAKLQKLLCDKDKDEAVRLEMETFALRLRKFIMTCEAGIIWDSRELSNEEAQKVARQVASEVFGKVMVGINRIVRGESLDTL